MRILHTEWSDGWGGQEHRIYHEMRGLVARGHEVTLVTRPQCRIREKAAAAGIPVVTLPMRKALDFGSIVALRRLLRENNVEVVNTHSGVDSWIGGLAAKLARTPVLLRTRHLNIPLRRNWLNFVHYLPDRIITCGETMRRQLIESSGFPEARLVSIATGIDFAEFEPRRPRREVRQALGLCEVEVMILMVGILRTVKGHDTALQAFQILSSKFPDAALVLAGDGPLLPAMEQLAHTLGIAKRVRFLGFRNDIPDLMGAADVLLLTSRSEGVPQTVTQALGLGLPVVATSVGGVSELVQSEQSGLLIPPGDPDAAADAVRRIIGDPGMAERFRAAGRVRVRQNFSLQAMLDKTERVCLELLETKRRAFV